MEFRLLSTQDKEPVTALFRDVFTEDPWNDDWSDPEQLGAYIDDLIGQSNSLTLGYLDGDRLVGLSMGRINTGMKARNTASTNSVSRDRISIGASAAVS